MNVNRVWQKVVGSAGALLLVGGPAWAQIEVNNRLPCPNGACVPNRMTFGYYPTRWRKWPVSAPPADGPEAAARAGVQPPATNEPPPVNEDEVRSPFERLPQRQQTEAPAEGEYEPLPSPEGGGPPNGDRGGDGTGNEGNGGGRQGPGAPRNPQIDRPRIFQDPRGNRLPETRRQIPDGTNLSSPADEFGSLALEPPARLTPSATRPVSYATSAKQPKKLESIPARKMPAPSGRPAAGNPLRKPSEAARPLPPADERADEEGPQIVPTAAWIEEAADKPATAKATASTSPWRANPLRSR